MTKHEFLEKGNIYFPYANFSEEITEKNCRGAISLEDYANLIWTAFSDSCKWSPEDQNISLDKIMPGLYLVSDEYLHYEKDIANKKLDHRCYLLFEREGYSDYIQTLDEDFMDILKNFILTYKI